MDQITLNAHLDNLAARDDDVAAGLELVKYPEPRVRPAGLETLISIIASQQISTKASAAIMARIRALLPDMNVGSLLSLPDDALREAGLSQRKREYVVGLSEAIASGKLSLQALASMDDHSAIKKITALRGFGVWSAEVYLMFSLQREDIFPADDLALQVALQKLKKMPERPSAKTARECTAHWSPYRSAASLFLWHYHRGEPGQ